MNTSQITTGDLLSVLKKRFIWILLAAIVVGAVSAVCGEFIIRNQYTCSLTCMLGDSNMSSAEFSQLSKNTERSRYVLGTRDVVAKVVESAHIVDSETGDPAVSEMMKATSISANTDRGSYTISVTSEDPEVSYAMILAYQDLMPELIKEHRLFAATVVEVSSRAPSSPSNGGRALRFGAIGFLLGALVVYGLFLIRMVTDVTIYTSSDLAKATDIPVIGMIPRYAEAPADPVQSDIIRYSNDKEGREKR